MGYLTTITIHNDALHTFEEHPEEFAKALFDGIHKANSARIATDVGFKGYCNYITIEPSRHADDDTVFVHHGNTVLNLNPWNQDFKELLSRPSVAEGFLKSAEITLQCAREQLNKAKKLAKEGKNL